MPAPRTRSHREEERPQQSTPGKRCRSRAGVQEGRPEGMNGAIPTKEYDTGADYGGALGNLTTSFLSAAKLIYAIGAGVTAAAGLLYRRRLLLLPCVPRSRVTRLNKQQALSRVGMDYTLRSLFLFSYKEKRPQSIVVSEPSPFISSLRERWAGAWMRIDLQNHAALIGQ